MLTMDVASGTHVPARFAALGELIGNTPMLCIDYRYRGRTGTVCAKAEHLNLSGSIKDRMALYILRTAYADGTLHAADEIVEATSGNTGISFAAIGGALGHAVVIYMPDWMSRERQDLIRSYGAEVRLISKAEGGFLGSIARCRAASRDDARVFLPEQFENAANVAAHARGTGPEIAAQLLRAGSAPDAFVAGIGTGGTIMGVTQALRLTWPGLRCHPVEPAESPTLTTGYKVGSHRIQGISDEFIPDIVKLSAIDRVLAIQDGDAIIMAQQLARTLGLAVGISSGCNFLAAVIAGSQLGNGSVVATVFPDDNKKYLSTALLREERCCDSFMTPQIELLDLRVIPRCGPHN